MDIHTLLQDIAVSEGHARSLREKLSGNISLELNCDTVDYRDTASVESRLSHGKELLRSLKELGKVLRSLTRYTEHSIYQTENMLRPLVLHDGINSLPDEVLAMIFEKAITSVGLHSKWDTRTLASVNHTFRNAAIGSRKLWSTLSHEKGKKVFKLFLEGSGDATLTILIGSRPPMWYMEEVLAVGHRWGKVVVIHSKNKLISKVHEYNGRHRTHQTYPRLQALQIYASEGLPRDDTNPTWNIPTIKFLSYTNTISALSNESFASLTTLEMTLHRCNLMETLRQICFMRNLQFLTLTLVNVSDCWKNVYPECDLKSLRRLRLEWSPYSGHYLRGFLNKINMGNVKEIELNCLGTNGDQFLLDIYDVFYYSSKARLRFPSLEDITIFAGSFDDDPVAYHIFHHPKLKSLTMKLTTIEPLDLENHPIKNFHLDIRTLTIVGCLSGARGFLEYLLSHVNPDGTKLCNGLVKLTVWDCANVTMDFLMDYLPEENIDFIPAIAYL